MRIRPIAGHRFDVETYMVEDFTATSTDAGVALEATPGRHPRYWGTYPRKNRPLHPRAGHHQPPLHGPFLHQPAGGDRGSDRPGLSPGRLPGGHRAFDYEAVEDNATILHPDAAPTGIPWVLVNGEIAIENGAATGALAGAVIRRGE